MTIWPLWDKKTKNLWKKKSSGGVFMKCGGLRFGIGKKKKKGPSKGDKICQGNVVELMLEHKVSGRAWSMVRILMQNSLDPGDKIKLFLCRGYFDRNLSDSQYDPREDIKRIIVVLSAKTRSRLKAMGFFFIPETKFPFARTLFCIWGCHTCRMVADVCDSNKP